MIQERNQKAPSLAAVLVLFCLCLAPAVVLAQAESQAGGLEAGLAWPGGLRQKLASPDGSKLFNLEGGGEVVNRRLGLRLGGGATWYTADRRQGLRLEGAVVQGEARHEILRLLLSAGSKLDEESQAVVSAGWLNRYAWGNYPGVGDQGDHLNQYVLGLGLERRLRRPGEAWLPGVTASLSGLYYQVDSKTVWSGYQDVEDSRSFTRYFSEYGLGGGRQYEALAGVELAWKPLSLELRAGLRHKEFDQHLGRSSQEQDAPKALGRLTLHDLLGCELSGFYTWDPDLRVLGGEARRQLWGPFGLVGRAEQVTGEDRPDDTRYFLGLDLWLGSQPRPRGASALPAALAGAERERQEARERREAYHSGDWLRPVRGSEVEHVQVMRQVQRQTRITEVSKSGLAGGVSVNGKGEMVFGGLPPLSSLLYARPAAAAAAFSISGGQLRAALASLPAPADIVLKLQQVDGLRSVLRLRTSRGSVVVDSVQSSSNLSDCQADSIVNNPDSIGDPPPSTPSMGQVPDQSVGFMQAFSLDLAAYASGASVTRYELSGSLPPGVSFNTATGELSGRPSRGGSFALYVRAMGGCGWSNYASFTLTVGEEPPPPPPQQGN